MMHRATMRRVTAALAAVGALGLLAPALIAADGNEPFESYRILVDRNIFVRNRRPPMPDRPDRRPTEYRAPTAPRLVLTGTARSGDSIIAFFENSRTGDTRRVSVGKTLGEAVIQAITLDGAVIQDGETTRTIRIGSDLSGQTVALPRPATTTVATSPPAAPSRPEEREDERGGPPEPPEEGGQPGEPPSEPQEAATPENADSADAIAEILERMRQRREEELRR